ncbi:MAG TPA: SUMF1/EgtB/PvdO family nonheme iron enzyme [Pirellulales bacterium]|nr:SUMF1/EgtB/PvdO family nonheme iron enzyme [Pirellulales bacterium]
MSAANTDCPSESLLSDFGLGKLDAALAETVGRHLDTCADCRQRVSDLPGDSFVDRLRGARGLGSSQPEASATPELKSTAACEGEVNERRQPGNVLADVVVPPELASLPDYEVLSKLGRGGMGVVYLARNRSLGRVEVLKVVNQALLNQPGALERFQQEIRSAAKLRHSNVVAAYTALRAGDLLVFAMEYVPGQDLAQVVKQSGPLPVAHATYYVHQVALGLEHAHQKGMVHRDIKPNNLMLSIEGDKHAVKILDFGLAKATSERGLESDFTKSGQMLGTPGYVAPEQALDARRADIRADIYSLGCTLYFLLSGKTPFQGASLYEVLEAHQKREPVALNRLRSDVPMSLAAITAKMMAKKPVDRYETPIAVAQALLPFFKPDLMPAAPTAADELPPTINLAAADSKATTQRNRRRAAQTVAFVLMVGALVTGIAAHFKASGVGPVESNVQHAMPATEGRPADSESSNAPKRFACDIPTAFSESWSIDGDELVQSSLQPGVCLFFGDPSWTDYDFSFDVKLLDGWGLRTHFRYEEEANHYSYVIGALNNTLQFVECASNGKFGLVAQGPFKLCEGDWYHVEVKVRGPHGDCFLDGHNILPTFNTDRQAHGRVGWCMETGAAFRFRNIRVKDAEGTILLEGLPQLPRLEGARGDAAPQLARPVRGVDGMEPARAPFSVEKAKYYQDRCARALNTRVLLANSIGMRLTLIPPGEFMMGTSQAEVDGLVASVTNKDWQDQFRSESPRHRVLLTQAFYLGTFEVTRQQYTDVMGRKQSSVADGARGEQGRVRVQDANQHPMHTVSWFDAVEFCNRLSKRESLAPYYARQDDRVAVLGGEGYRLPTEAEWEYACRAGTTSPWPCGYEASSAWKHGVLHPAGSIQAVGTRLANAFGMYDMLGNVWEWCWDAHGAYAAVDVGDTSGPDNSAWRVLRGSSYKISTAYARSAKRWYASPASTWDDAGFRVARTCAGQGSVSD